MQDVKPIVHTDLERDGVNPKVTAENLRKIEEKVNELIQFVKNVQDSNTQKSR